jgi:hypothetical protein
VALPSVQFQTDAAKRQPERIELFVVGVDLPDSNVYRNLASFPYEHYYLAANSGNMQTLAADFVRRLCNGPTT